MRALHLGQRNEGTQVSREERTKSQYSGRVREMRPTRPRRTRGPAPATSGARDLASQLFGRKPEHVLLLLRAAWPAVVGPELARRTQVVGLEGRTLRVRVPDAGWRKVLHRMNRDILTRLYTMVGSLAPSALGLQEGQVVGAPAPKAGDARALPPAEVTATIRAAADVIGDPELRERFAASAALYLRRHGGA